MKAKKQSKSGKKPHAKKPARNKSRRTGQTRTNPKIVETPASSASNLKIKTCEEVEIGDIGGFGSTEELESHENRCVQPATLVCASCGRDLCGTHYELLHRDHDLEHGYKSKESLAQAQSATSDY